MAQLDQFTESTGRRLEVLARTGWLSRQPADFQALVARLGRWRNAAAGEILYIAGDTPDGLYGLGEGMLEVTFPLIGDEPVVIHRAEPGFWLGEAAVLTGQERFVTLAAATPSRVFFIPGSSIRQIVEKEPNYWRCFYDQCLTNQITTVTLLAEALSLSPRARLARILLRLARPDGSVPGSQEELARLLGMTRSSVRRALTSLVEDGAVESGYGILSVRDRGRLQRLTHEP